MLIWIRLRNISELKDATKNSRTPSVPFEILAATAPSKGANHLSCSRLSLTFQWGACHSKWMTMDREPHRIFSLHFVSIFFLILGFVWCTVRAAQKLCLCEWFYRKESVNSENFPMKINLTLLQISLHEVKEIASTHVRSSWHFALPKLCLSSIERIHPHLLGTPTAS